jgi:hypothetical protein
VTADSWLEENGAIGQIAVTHALDVLRRTPSGVRVLGADGFTEVNHPTLDFIADFSRSPMTPEESVATAIDTLASWPTDLLVELVVSDE